MTRRVPDSTPARRATQRTPRIVATGFLVIAVIVAALASQSLAPSSSTATSFVATEPTAHPQRKLPTELGAAEGAIPDGTTVFDNDVPGVANLDPALLGALRRAATAAAGRGVELFVQSGWRSPGYQEQLLHEAIAQYGSEEEAARWVATPRTSAHVSGDAVDIGHGDAMTWLSERGAEFGLCQIYENEPWHYELRADATADGCPAMYADPTHDPRMN